MRPLSIRVPCFRASATSLLATLLTAALMTAQPTRAQDVPPPAERVPGTSQDPAAAFRAASDKLASLKGVRGADRVTGLREAAAMYARIATDFDDRPETVARAHYESGECLRRAGDVAEAERAYSACLEADRGSFRERASFERGSMLRRLERWDDAVASYRIAIEARPASARADEARVWVGRCLESKGDNDGAREAYQDAVDSASSPERGVDACNRLGMFLVRRGELEAAGAIVERAEQIAEPVLQAGGKAAERMQERLDEMSVRRSLQRAIDRRDDAAGDAVRLDEATRGRSAGAALR
ncbi:MAG: tetratricopeptide repeat protein [Planctomycetes bacterium]|nr:tetratricopeptide repeat protein [Planctomycetota bacterium]